MRLSANEIAVREVRRTLILKRICPDCGGYLHDETKIHVAKYHWFTCGKCYCTMGVTKQEGEGNAHND